MAELAHRIIMPSKYWPRKSEDHNPFRKIWFEFQDSLGLLRLQS